MKYNISYLGNGTLFIAATQSGGVFQQVNFNALNQRYETEWVPGFGGLSFSKETWENFIAKSLEEKMLGVHMQHPSWSCTEYTEFLQGLGQ